jgi:hypothetical protein
MKLYKLNPIYIVQHRDHIVPFLRKQVKAVLYRLFGWKIQRYIDKSIQSAIDKKLGCSVDERVKNYIDQSVHHALIERDREINKQRLLKLKDKHKGQRAFVIGNGPSLRISDLDRLKGEVTFASNKIYLAFEETDWRPTYYTVLDVLVAENNNETIRKQKLTKIFDEAVREYFSDAYDIIWLKYRHCPDKNGKKQFDFSTDILLGCYPGWSVTHEQLQLAFYMGIRKIYLIGVDFCFTVPKPTGEMSGHGEVLRHEGEQNHFHPNYRQPGETWTMPKLDLQYQAFLAAKRVVEANGGKIYNASRKTVLDIFPKVNFDEIVSA